MSGIYHYLTFAKRTCWYRDGYDLLKRVNLSRMRYVRVTSALYDIEAHMTESRLDGERNDKRRRFRRNRLSYQLVVRAIVIFNDL